MTAVDGRGAQMGVGRWFVVLAMAWGLVGCAGSGGGPVVPRTGPAAAVAPAPEAPVAHAAPVRAGASDARGIEVRSLETPPAPVITSSVITPSTVARTMPRGLKVPYSEALWNEMKAADQAAMAALATAPKSKPNEARATASSDADGKTKAALKPEDKGERSEAKPADDARHQAKPEPARTDEQRADAGSEGGRDWAWPAPGRVVQTFDGSANKGLMIAGKAGDPVLAAADGQVIFSGAGPRGYGNLVIVKHPKDLVSVYAQNRSLLVKEGQQVKRGQKLAELGETPQNGPRLQFEIRQRGKPVDPGRFLPRR